MDLFSIDELNRIRNHKYKSQGLSTLEAVFEPYWKKCVSKLPRRLSPNALTLFGLLSILSPGLVLLYCSYQGYIETIPLISLCCSFGFIVWMNMDCMDGKLARQNRPHHQSAFGELLDHGGDAFTVLIVSIALCCQIGLDRNPLLLLIFVLINICTNYVSEPWTVYLTGILQFQSIDFVEITLVMSAISFITGLFGIEIWQTMIFKYFNFQLGHLIFVIQILIAQDLIFGKFPTLLATRKEKGWELSDIAFPAISQAILILCAFISYYFSTTEFLSQNIILFTLLFGIIEIKLHVKFLVLKVISAKFRELDHSLLFSIAFSFGVMVLQLAKMERYLLFALLAIASFDAAVYFFRLFYQLYNVFDERIFLLDVVADSNNLNRKTKEN